MASEPTSSQYQGNRQPQFGAPAPDIGRNNPNLPQSRVPRLTEEEKNLLQECDTESFYYRSLPLSAVLGGTTTYLVKTGYLKSHPRYGGTLKTLGAVFLGFIVGKVSYQSTCQQKIMERLPHSNLAKFIRKSRGISSESEGEMMTDSGAEFGYTQQKMGDEYSKSDTFPDFRPGNVKELDDTLRPSLDREVAPASADEVDKVPQRTLTYDELRRKNREDYDRSGVLSPDSPFRQRPFPPPRPPSQSAPSESKAVWDSPPPQSPGRAFDTSRKQTTNKYGDVWDNNP